MEEARSRGEEMEGKADEINKDERRRMEGERGEADKQNRTCTGQ